MPGGRADRYKPSCLQADVPLVVGFAARPLGPIR